MEIRKLAKWFGLSHDVGQATCSKLLTKKGQIVCRTSVFPLSVEDLNSEVVKKQMTEFEDRLKEALRDGSDPCCQRCDRG